MLSHSSEHDDRLDSLNSLLHIEFYNMKMSSNVGVLGFTYVDTQQQLEFSHPRESNQYASPSLSMLLPGT